MTLFPNLGFQVTKGFIIVGMLQVEMVHENIKQACRPLSTQRQVISVPTSTPFACIDNHHCSIGHAQAAHNLSNKTSKPGASSILIFLLS